MSEAGRTRTGGVTLATVFLAGATVYATHDERRYASNNAHLAKSFEASTADWSDERRAREVAEADAVYQAISGRRPVEERIPFRDCIDEDDDEHCYRELYRSLIESYEAGADYYEVAMTSPSGVGFVKPTTVRRLPERATYATKHCHGETDDWVCCGTE